MAETVTFRLDPETGRILRELTRRRRSTKTAVIKKALRSEWDTEALPSRPSAWEVYSRLHPRLPPPPPGPKRDRARNVSRLFKEMLLAKRRAGTL